MKLFTMTSLILCGFLLASVTISIIIAQLDPSSSKSPDVTENSTDILVQEETVEVGECIFSVNKTETLPHNGTLKPQENCVWNIIGNISQIGTSCLMFEKVHLGADDSLTIHNASETLIFGPYSGIIGTLVIAVDEKNFTVKLSTSASKAVRAFEVMYSENCVLNIPPSIEVISLPIYRQNVNLISCTYDFKKIHEEISYSFVFKNFSLDSGSNLVVTSDGQAETYTKTPPDIFGSVVRFNLTLNSSSSANALTILRREVYHACSGYIPVSPTTVPVIKSPTALKSYNDTTIFECRWLIKSDSASNVLGLLVDKLQFNTVFDMLIINDGPSELSPPIAQAALVNQDETKVQVIRTSGQYMWISFRSEAFASNFSGNYSQGQGGYHSGSGSISMQSGTDAIFLLEVAQEEKVLLNFSSSDIANPATISIYDGFKTVSNLIAQLSGPIWYPVVSSTSKMMVVAKHFDGRKFAADFRGIKSDCIHMSTSSNDAYVVSGNCNSSCSWIVPPKNMSEGVLMLGFQFLSLDVTDVVEVFRLGDSKTPVAKIAYGMKPVPPLSFSPREGFYMQITRGDCRSKEDVILVAHSTYLPGCSGNFALVPSTELQLSSPNYPNMYPLFADCQWNLTGSGNTSHFYLAFNSMKLAPNHCIQITHAINGNLTKTEVFSGDTLPNDMLFGNTEIYFDAFICNKSSAPVPLVSDEGFLLNVTSSDCGGVLTSKTGNFNTNSTASKGKSICFWIIEVPYNESDGSVNSIMFTVDIKEVKGNNSEFQIHDGPSVRDTVMGNVTGNIWSRRNTVIFVYKRLNATAPSSLFTINYKTINCNKTMQCGNGICLHPDWLCDGSNDCGDFTDEKNCETVPVPEPTKETTGVSALTFGLVTVLFFILGALATFLIPKAINRYRNGRYHQFQDYAGVD